MATELQKPTLPRDLLPCVLGFVDKPEFEVILPGKFWHCPCKGEKLCDHHEAERKVIKGWDPETLEAYYEIFGNPDERDLYYPLDFDRFEERYEGYFCGTWDGHRKTTPEEEFCEDFIKEHYPDLVEQLSEGNAPWWFRQCIKIDYQKMWDDGLSQDYSHHNGYFFRET